MNLFVLHNINTIKNFNETLFKDFTFLALDIESALFLKKKRSQTYFFRGLA